MDHVHKDAPIPIRAQIFKDELEQVCKKHDLLLVCEDSYSGFEVGDYNEEDMCYITEASLDGDYYADMIETVVNDAKQAISGLIDCKE